MGELKSNGVEVDDEFFERIIKSIDMNNEGFVRFDEFEIHMMKMVENMESPSVTLLWTFLGNNKKEWITVIQIKMNK